MAKQKRISKKKSVSLAQTQQIKDHTPSFVNYDKYELVPSMKYLRTDFTNNKFQYEDMKAFLNQLRSLCGMSWEQIKKRSRLKKLVDML